MASDDQHEVPTAAARRAAQAGRAIPRLPGLPILGSLAGMLRDAPGTLEAGARRFGGQLFSLRLGPMEVPVVSQPALLQQVLVEDARAFSKGGKMWSSTRPVLGNGLVTSEGDFWLRQRRLMQPLFSQKYLAALAERMVRAIERERARLEGSLGREVEFGHEMTQLTQRVLLETMFSVSLESAEASRLGEALSFAFDQMNTRLFLYFLPSWVRLPGDAAYRRAIAEIDQTLARVVRERRRNPGPEDLLSRLLDAKDADTGEQMSDAQLRDELVTLFAAGLDTTAVTLTWLFWLLDAHPEVDRKLRAEVAEVLDGRLPAVEDLPRLVFTKQALQEAMRLYPPAWIFPRYCAEDTLLGEYRVRADTTMLLSPYLAHRDPAAWENPSRFDPERFAPGAGGERHRFAYFPFGGGGRQCIGNHFAMMEGTLIVAMLAQRLRPRLCAGKPPIPAAATTLKPKDGLRMRLERA